LPADLQQKDGFRNYTVPKAFSMHETFPKLLENIEEVKISKKFWKQFMVVLEILTGPIFPGSFGKSS
jgi:hypothetical protein